MFKDYHFKEYINKGLEAIGFTEETEIQKMVLKKALKGENIIGKSVTGSGKTHAFILPILERLTPLDELDAIIIVPTRELGNQIYTEITKITSFSKDFIDVRLFVGGTDRDNEIERLKVKQPKIAIGTIGKIRDLGVTANVLKYYTAKMAVVDEADMVFETNEFEEVDSIFARLLNPQILTFSATISKPMMHFLDKYLAKSEVIDLVGKKSQNEKIEHLFIQTKGRNKSELLYDLLRSFNPYLVLIFCNTKMMVDEVSNFLVSKGLKIVKLSGDLEARERKQVLKRIKDGEFQYVVCSDIASRGIDISGVSHVINFDLPSDIEFFIHRIGRTARYNQTGTSISFYDYEDDDYIKRLKEKGIVCHFKNLKGGELVDARAKFNPNNKKMSEAEKILHHKIPLSKKVKPGYKKKRKEEIKKEARKLNRARINEIYKKRARAKKNED